MQRSLILASSSSTRKDLMNRLHLDYQAISPDIDESSKAGESADDLAQRLSIEKANVIAQLHPEAIVIGSDQVAWLEDEPNTFIGKPYSVENAIQQLKSQSGKVLNFSTGLSIQCLATKQSFNEVVNFQVKFRTLDLEEIQRYVKQDQPLHCAGSFKCESLGITLFEWMRGDDFTALMGLPLIKLCKILNQVGFKLP